MNYLKLLTTTAQNEAYLSATSSQRGIWLTMLIFCTTHENSGIIKNFTSWSHFKTRKLFHSHLSTILHPSPLWHIENSDLIVHLYPIQQESAIQNQRKNLATNSTTASTSHSPILTAINSIHSPWHNKPLTAAERISFRENADSLTSLTPDDIALLTNYYHAVHSSGIKKSPDGSKFYAPTSRASFFSNVVDILSHANSWKNIYKFSKKHPSTTNPPSSPTSPSLSPEEEEANRQACLEILKSIKVK